MAATSASNSGLHSESASSPSLAPPKEEQDVSSENFAVLEPKKEEPFLNMDNQEDKQKYENYASEMASYLKAKYFSDKTIFGGNIYDVKVNIDGETVKASRLPPHQSYADPASFHDLLNSVQKSAEETPGDSSNAKHSGKN
ncbi:hypothetical protein ACH5RR_008693 [Cinchona calisaya]|uniref:Uncharacterized protein n=1 Tax=Cinchona calisaya TaxID=153742 RepID=A0ABD3AC76_9GENT